MKCYDFELNISAYIEGELKQTVREEFTQHIKSCQNCDKKLVDISKMMENLPNLIQMRTSSKFEQKLQLGIRDIENRGPSLWQRLMAIKPLGFEPGPALGFALAIMVVISASYLLINQDELPDVDLNKLSSQNKQNTHQNFKPSVITPKHNLPSMADSDTSGKSNTISQNKRIQLVGRK